MISKVFRQMFFVLMFVCNYTCIYIMFLFIPTRVCFQLDTWENCNNNAAHLGLGTEAIVFRIILYSTEYNYCRTDIIIKFSIALLAKYNSIIEEFWCFSDEGITHSLSPRVFAYLNMSADELKPVILLHVIL